MQTTKLEGAELSGRKWYTSKGNNISMTTIYEPYMDLKRFEKFTVRVAEVIVKALHEKFGVTLDVKKPNDLMINGKKVAGILTETEVLGETVSTLLVGVGMNVNVEEFPSSIEDIATSLKKEYGQEFSREEIIVEICNAIDGLYTELMKF